MVDRKNPLDYIPLNEGAGVRSDGRVEDWVQLWWKDGTGKAWSRHGLKVLEPNDWFDLSNNQAPRLWISPQ